MVADDTYTLYYCRDNVDKDHIKCVGFSYPNIAFEDDSPGYRVDCDCPCHPQIEKELAEILDRALPKKVW